MQKFLFGAAFALFSLSSSVSAQTPISLPAPSPDARLQLRDGTASLFERKPKNGAVSGTLSGDAGHYFAQWVAPDKTRTPLGAPISIVIPGVRREAGAWNFNGSPLVETAPESEFVTAPPRFLPNLARSSKTKIPFSTVTNATQNWATIPVSGADLHKAGASFVLPPLPAKSPRSGFYVGYELRATNDVSRDDVRRLRVQIESQSPGAALILSVDAASLLVDAPRILDALAPLCDAVKLELGVSNPTGTNIIGDETHILERPFNSQLWSMKIARRIAEEQPDYDLPIFAMPSAPSLWFRTLSEGPMFSPMPRQFSPAQAAEIWMSGATGIVVSPAQRETLAPLETLWRQNANWLSGAVTYEDTAILPNASGTTDVFVQKLRDASRVPLLGRATLENKAATDSLLTIFDGKTEGDTLRALRRSAEDGETIYVEGTPPKHLWPTWGQITKTQISALETPQSEVLTLDDVWIFGTQNGREFPVSQVAKIEFSPDLAAEANEKKGEARETKTRAIGKLTRDTNGFLLAPVGKGRILWAPHAFEKTPDAPFYGAISGAIQTALANVTLDDGTPISGKNVRFAVRGSQEKTAILGVFNDASETRKLRVSMRSGAQIVENLRNGQTVPSKLRGFSTTFETEIAPSDWAIFSFYENEKARETQFKKANLKARWR